MTDLIKVENQDFNKGKLFTTSLIMAERFDKPHNDLLKIIRNVIEDSEGFNVGRFSLVKYTDKKGEERPYYQLDKDAFMSNLDKMADDALESGSPQNTMRIPTKEQIIEIYKKLF